MHSFVVNLRGLLRILLKRFREPIPFCLGQIGNIRIPKRSRFDYERLEAVDRRCRAFWPWSVPKGTLFVRNEQLFRRRPLV